MFSCVNKFFSTQKHPVPAMSHSIFRGANIRRRTDTSVKPTVTTGSEIEYKTKGSAHELPPTPVAVEPKASSAPASVNIEPVAPVAEPVPTPVVEPQVSKNPAPVPSNDTKLFNEQWTQTNQIFSIIVDKPDKQSAERLDIPRSSIRANLLALQPYSTLPHSEIPEAIVTMMAQMADIMNVLHAAPDIYNEVMKDIAHVFPQESKAEPGSMAAYFTGCSMTQGDNFPGPPGCNPKCAGSLWRTSDSAMSHLCNDSVIIFKNNTFEMLVNQKTDHGYVYVGRDHTGFRRSDVNALIGFGLASVTIVHGEYDTKGEYTNSYSKIESRVPVVNLSITDAEKPITEIGSVDLVSVDPAVLGTDNTVTETNSSPAVVLFLIFIVLLVAGVLIYTTSRPRRMVGQSRMTTTRAAPARAIMPMPLY